MENNDKISDEINMQNLLIEHLEYLRKEIENKNSQNDKLNYVINSISNLKKEDENSINYSQFSEGILIKTQIKRTDEFLVNIGSNIFIKKNKEDLINSLKEMLNNNSIELKNLEDKY